MGNNSLHFNFLKKRVLDIANLKYILAADCKALSLQISKATGKYISETTVKRIYGFAQAKFEASAFTKNVMAQFCNYNSWEDYISKTGTAVQDHYENIQSTDRIAQLKPFFDGIPNRVLLLKAVYNTTGQILDFEIKLVNQATEAMTGRTDLPEKLCCEEFPGIKQAGLYQLMLQVMQTGEPKQIEYYYHYEGFDGGYCSMFIKTAEGLLTIHCDSATADSKKSIMLPI